MSVDITFVIPEFENGAEQTGQEEQISEPVSDEERAEFEGGVLNFEPARF